jgi:hypothetical protein
MDRILRGEDRFYQGVLIQRQSYHDDYVCLFDGVAMSHSDMTDSSTQVPVIRRTWRLWRRPVVSGIKCHRFSRSGCR